MKTNGRISFEQVTAGGVDEWGEPIPAVQGWGEEMDCLIETNTDTRLGKYEDGEFRQASFTIIMEGVIPTFIARVKLSRYGEELGEYRVQTIAPIPNMGRTKLTVSSCQ